MNYPFVKCLEPKYIRNKYTNEPMIVGCGKCEACLSRKSAMATLKCRLECSMNIYNKFVTLTYDEDCVPRMKLDVVTEVIEESSGIHVFPMYEYGYYEYTGRLAENSPRLLAYCPSLDSHNALVDKVENHDLPHLSKRDLQLFIKRIRKYISDYGKKNNVPTGQIRYYACGEYGPVHFRPHYHIIFSYNCDIINSIINEAVLSCWTYGRVTTEIPRGDVSSYVAKYVNSYCSLPTIYKQPQTKPFTIHSQHLGESFFQASKETIYEQAPIEAVRRCSVIAGSYSDINMWRSLEAYYFPRCKMYNVLPSSERYEAYTIGAGVQQYTKTENIAEQARRILKDIYNITNFVGKLPHSITYSFDECVDKMFHNIIDMCDIEPIHLSREEYWNKAFRSVYMYLRTSHHFMRFVCDGDPNKYLPMLKKIEHHYLELELNSMNESYRQLEENLDEWFENDEELILMYLRHDNVPHAITGTTIYKKYRSEVITRFNNSIKHKKLNDLNRVFEQY